MQNNFSFGHYDRIVIHTPHAGTILPIHYLVIKHADAIRSNNSRSKFIRPYFRLLTDHYTNKLFSFVAEGPYILKSGYLHSNIQQITFPYSRLFCDVERLENDPLEERGLGIHYDFNKIADFNFNSYWNYGKEKAIELYNEHQKKLLASINYPLLGRSLILDCHSFSEQDNVLCPNAHEFKDIDICIGFNEDETKPSGEFIDSIKEFFTACGYRVEFNKPFSNSKTVKGYSNWFHPYNTLMIEVNKHCYMNEDTLAITAGYYKLHSELQILYNLLLNS